MSAGIAMAARPDPGLEALRDSWQDAWPRALDLWSRFTKLQEPRWCFTDKEEQAEGLSGSFAMIRFKDHGIVISLRQVRALGLADYAIEILAHEIGHHLYAPGDLHDHARMLARMRAGLPGKEQAADYVANLYTDLLINDRLQRIAELRIAEIYRLLENGSEARSSSKLWTLYMRIYECLWALPRGALASAETDEFLELDATLGARLIRSHAKDWLAGAGRFAVLCWCYLEDGDGAGERDLLRPLLDTEAAGEGGLPAGLTEIDEEELSGAVHPREDESLRDVEQGDGRSEQGSKRPHEHHRSPIDYRELLRSAGVDISEAEATIQYYRERALPHLIRFPERIVGESKDPLPESLETWDFGAPIEELDWFESVLVSPRVIPGATTVRRVHGLTAGSANDKQPLDLYLGVDCSGSMVNPRHSLSYPVLAGAIMVLSALRAGARVMVTLSGEPGRHASTDGFTHDEHAVLKVLTGYLGTGFAFGINRLADAFGKSRQRCRPAHIMILTDTDIFQMLDGGHGRNSGWDIALEALRAAEGGGTMVLHAYGNAQNDKVSRLRGDGWAVHHVTDWPQLVAFARAFAEETYQQVSTRAP